MQTKLKAARESTQLRRSTNVQTCHTDELTEFDGFGGNHALQRLCLRGASQPEFAPKRKYVQWRTKKKTKQGSEWGREVEGGGGKQRTDGSNEGEGKGSFV